MRRKNECYCLNGPLIFLSFTKVSKRGGTYLKLLLLSHVKTICSGKYVKFKAKCFVIDAYAGFVQKEYDWKETNSDGHYVQLILPTDFPDCAFNYRFHVTILE